MELPMDDPKDRETIALAGDLKLPQAGTLKNSLLQALEGDKDLVVAIDQVNEVDVSCLQVFCAAHRTFLKSGRRLVFNGPLPPLFLKSMEEAGFGRERGCALNRTKTCLWAQGEDR
jgi:anti-anti-sigma regulatory factor